MKKLALAFLVVGLTASPVAAGVVTPTGWSWSWVNACGGDNYSTCMSGSVSYNDFTKTVSVSVTNLPDAWGDVFTGVGLFNLPARAQDKLQGGVVVIEGIAESCTGPGAFDCPSNHLNGPLGDTKYIYAAGVSGSPNGFPIAGGTLPGATQQFTFRFNTSLQDYAGSIGVGIHAQRGPGCSTKFGVVDSDYNYDSQEPQMGAAYNPFPAGAAPCGTSVPEPSSLFLLGSGFAGMAFVASRRRKNEIVDEDGNDVEI